MRRLPDGGFAKPQALLDDRGEVLRVGQYWHSPTDGSQGSWQRRDDPHGIAAAPLARRHVAWKWSGPVPGKVGVDREQQAASPPGLCFAARCVPRPALGPAPLHGPRWAQEPKAQRVDRSAEEKTSVAPSVPCTRGVSAVAG